MPSLDAQAVTPPADGALAAGSGPMTPSDVQAELDSDLAYTTVMTTLTRLFDKGALSRERVGRAYAYRLASAPEAVPAVLAAHQMRRLLDSGADRATVLTRFVAELGPDDEQLLVQLLAESPDADAPSPAPPATDT